MPASARIFSTALSGSATSSALGTIGLKPAFPWPGKQLSLCGMYDGVAQTGGNFADQEIALVQVAAGDILMGGQVFWDTGVANLTATIGIQPVISGSCGNISNCNLFGSINMAAAGTSATTCSIFNMTNVGFPVPVDSYIVVRTNNVALGTSMKITLRQDLLRP